MTRTMEPEAVQHPKVPRRAPLGQVFAWSLLIVGFLSAIATLTSDQATNNGTLATLIDAALMVAVNGAVWGALITGGVAIYRKVRPGPPFSADAEPSRGWVRSWTIVAGVLAAVLIVTAFATSSRDQTRDPVSGIPGLNLDATSDDPSALEADLAPLVQLRPAIQDWNMSLAPLVADLNDDSVTVDEWLTKHGPTIDHAKQTVARMRLVSQSGSERGRQLTEPYVHHYEVELAALQDLRDAFAAGDQTGAENAFDRIRAEAPRATELGCNVIEKVRAEYPAAEVEAKIESSGIDKLCA